MQDVQQLLNLYERTNEIGRDFLIDQAKKCVRDWPANVVATLPTLRLVPPLPVRTPHGRLDAIGNHSSCHLVAKTPCNK